MQHPSISERIELLTQLQSFLQSDSTPVRTAIELAERANGWFTIDNIEHAIDNICKQFLDASKVQAWVENYPNIAANTATNKVLGIVMAGNIPLVGFHDFLCGFVSGMKLKLKHSSKDEVLWKMIIGFIHEQDKRYQTLIEISERLNHCDAYIATGSNNTARYFEEYFGKYPSIIRKNRTSVALLQGNESPSELLGLKEDCTRYFGLGCRNVTKLYVPQGYDLTTLINLFDKDDSLIAHNKYQNNFDYHLAIYLLNKVNFIQGRNILLVESTSPFAPTATLHFEYYQPEKKEELLASLDSNDDIQAIVTKVCKAAKTVAFGQTQSPKLTDYADGVDTMAFLNSLLQ